jgi:tRNA pseudouridine55 synthase
MFLLINKPPGITSHDVIDKLRRITGIKRIGHAGTLDPFATGLLIVGLDRQSTKELGLISKLDKTYETTLKLGAISDTYDLTGKITQTANYKPSTVSCQLSSVLKKFIGEQLQLPPIYSAKKIRGKKAYELARQGKIPKLKPQKIVIYDIKLKKINKSDSYLLMTVSCSSGTYIRSLAHDIGQALGSGAYLTKLIRTQIGPFKLSAAVELKKLTAQNWQKHALIHPLDLNQATKVLVFGTFDRLHAGHINFFEQAKNLGQRLYVVIARDANVKRLKGKLPRQNETSRLQKIRRLDMVTQAMAGAKNLNQRYRVINKIKPDIIALGYDQKINLGELKNKLKKYKLQSKIVRLKAYQPTQYKTSKLSSQ